MHRENERFLSRMNMLVDGLIAFVALMLGYWIRFFVLPGALETYSVIFFVCLALYNMVVHIIVYSAMGMYSSIRIRRYTNLVMRIVFSEIICLLVTISTVFVIGYVETSRIAIFISAALGAIFLGAKYTFMQVFLRYHRKKGYNQKTLLLVGSGDTARHYARMLEEHPEFGYRILGFYAQEDDFLGHDWMGTYDELEEGLKRLVPDEAVIALRPEDYPFIKSIIHVCDKTGVRIRIIPCYDEYTSSKMGVETVEGINIVDIRVVPLSRLSNRIIKRAMDIVFSVFILIVTSPIMLIAIIGIKLTSPGPIIFRQERIGKDKKPFCMLKLRSMHVNDRSDTAWSGPEDERKTPFGSFLRKFSIDELPQFVNILRGDMSIVGPRPEIPHYVEQFRDEIPLYMIKHYVKPGITGWAQVNGYRGDTSIKARVEYDIHYIENWTFFFDIRIMFMTLFKLVNDEKIVTGGKSKRG